MTTCVVLAGGRGTRLRSVVPTVPKCLAPVAGRTFLQIQLERLSSQGVERFVLSLGHLAHRVVEVARQLRKQFDVDWVVEPTPLGTGGAALFAMHRAGLEEALVANGDTLLHAGLGALLTPLELPLGERARMAVVPSAGPARFGGVVVKRGKVTLFLPGGAPSAGLVNAGLYRIHRSAFAERFPGQAFSLEADVLKPLANEGALAAAVLAGPFADIGIAEDYRRFCEQFAASP